jgi:hypothetical protein
VNGEEINMEGEEMKVSNALGVPLQKLVGTDDNLRATVL